MRRFVMRLAWAGFALAAMIMLIGVMVDTPETKPAKTPDQIEAEDRARWPDRARTACRLAVPQVLNDPGSVEFVGEFRWPAEVDKDGLWRVTMSLRARNAFGALMLAEFACVVRQGADDWRVIDLRQLSP